MPRFLTESKKNWKLILCLTCMTKLWVKCLVTSTTKLNKTNLTTSHNKFNKYQRIVKKKIQNSKWVNKSNKRFTKMKFNRLNKRAMTCGLFAMNASNQFLQANTGMIVSNATIFVFVSVAIKRTNHTCIVLAKAKSLLTKAHLPTVMT